MTKEEFREQMKKLIALEILTRKNPEEHQKVMEERTKLNQEYRRSLYEEMLNEQETEINTEPKRRR